MNVIKRENFVKGIESLPHGAGLAISVWEQIFDGFGGPVNVLVGDQVFRHVLDQMWEHDFEELAPPSTKSG